jgi:hypothetical protein
MNIRQAVFSALHILLLWPRKTAAMQLAIIGDFAFSMSCSEHFEG